MINSNASFATTASDFQYEREVFRHFQTTPDQLPAEEMAPLIAWYRHTVNVIVELLEHLPTLASTDEKFVCEVPIFPQVKRDQINDCYSCDGEAQLVMSTVAMCFMMLGCEYHLGINLASAGSRIVMFEHLNKIMNVYVRTLKSAKMHVVEVYVMGSMLPDKGEGIRRMIGALGKQHGRRLLTDSKVAGHLCYFSDSIHPCLQRAVPVVPKGRPRTVSPLKVDAGLSVMTIQAFHVNSGMATIEIVATAVRTAISYAIKLGHITCITTRTADCKTSLGCKKRTFSVYTEEMGDEQLGKLWEIFD
jgi:hypothetical protein